MIDGLRLVGTCRTCNHPIVTASRAFGHYGAERNGWRHQDRVELHPATPRWGSKRYGS